MRLFISYGRRDATTVEGLVADLRQAGTDVVMDRSISGGQQWWDELLDGIRSCDVVVFALSPTSIGSRACRAELAYAVATARPVLPVMIEDTDIALAPDPIGVTQAVDYRRRDAASAIALMRAVASFEPGPRLPEPLPPDPPPPLTDLAPAREQLAKELLAPSEQEALFAELRGRRDELDQIGTLRALLTQFRRRSDLVESVARDIDALLARLPVEDDRDGEPRVRRPMSERDPESVDRLRSLLTYARSGRFTPILGHGLNDSIVGSPRRLAREWSRTFEFPMAEHQRESLADVAQFVAVMTNVDTLRESLGEYLRERIGARSPGAAPETEPTSLALAIREAWQAQRTDDDPYVVLAGLPCPIYVVAHPWDLLTDALREAGKSPVVDVCRWRPDVYDWPPSIFDEDPSFQPTAERPLVFHVFGALHTPDSLVITQDDFDEFMIAVAQNRAIIPGVVQSVLANSAIMLLGFELEERDVRVLMRSLVGQEGAHRLSRYTHVAAQLEYTTSVTSPERARRYLERYFSKFHQPSIDVFWGTAAEFTADLAELWGQGT